jgi:hypothetical protein
MAPGKSSIAAAVGLSLDREAEREFQRVLAIRRDRFAK